MRKGQGLAQQIRGQKRSQKVINRKLKRYPSDQSKYEGNYSRWMNEMLGINPGKTPEEIRLELEQQKSLPEVTESLVDTKEVEDARNDS
jgi:hypothetical protein